MRGFDHDLHRVVVDFGLQATHGASQRNRTAAVGDQHIRRTECSLHMVKRFEDLPRPCESHNDVTLQLRAIEGV